MTDAAIAEHIIYLINELKEEQKLAQTLYSAQFVSYNMAMRIFIEEYKLNPEAVKPPMPKRTTLHYSTLLDRITTTLENRSTDELIN